MRQLWINKGQNSTCILFFNGWGMDENAIAHLGYEGFDLCMYNNYSTLEPINNNFACYHKVFLVAWSLGVWAGEQVMSKSNIKVHKSIAINGTSSPLHNKYGIPASIFALTLEGWNESFRTKFNKRMMGGIKSSIDYQQFLSQRTIGDQKDELQSIYTTIKNDHQQFLCWDIAVIGQNDLIFPVVNQQNWWNGKTRIIEISQPHFPFIGLQHWEQLLKL